MNTHFPTVPVPIARQQSNFDTEVPPPLVLVVNDEPMIAETLTAILKGHGLAVMTALDGRVALEIARLMPPEVLITEVAMPGMNGFDLALEVAKTIPDCEVILFSGEPSSVDLVMTHQSEVQDFVTMIKPVHPTDLLACVFERLSQHGWPAPAGIAPRRVDLAEVYLFGPKRDEAKGRTGDQGDDRVSGRTLCRRPVARRRETRA